MILFLLQLAVAEDNWVATESDMKRWPDAEIVTGSLAVGDKVEVVFRDSRLVRVRKGSDFGWVSPAVLSPSEVAAPSDGAGLSGLSLPPLELPGLPGE
ncbi:MAG: hypothetical protein FJ102_07965 [Deltaproteobacteria bacterium]|nr:hypothetical protein [Deltaproteobacteria bacterium]